MIFSRGRGSSGRHAREDARRKGPRHAAGDSDDVYADSFEEAPEPAEDRTGPYDVSEAPSGVQRLDLGSLHIPAVEGVEVRVQANPDGGIQQVFLIHGDSALELGVFAAPRTAGIWAEVLDEIRRSLVAEGGTVEDAWGEYGAELRARIRTPEGSTDVRFVGVDGPRWMVRAVFQGRAATEPTAAGPLTECLHGLVVDRGTEAKPVREPLPLRLPREVAEQAEANVVVAESQAPPPGRINGAKPGEPAPPRRKQSPRPRRS